MSFSPADCESIGPDIVNHWKVGVFFTVCILLYIDVAKVVDLVVVVTGYLHIWRFQAPLAISYNVFERYFFLRNFLQALGLLRYLEGRAAVFMGWEIVMWSEFLQPIMLHWALNQEIFVCMQHQPKARLLVAPGLESFNHHLHLLIINAFFLLEQLL